MKGRTDEPEEMAITRQWLKKHVIVVNGVFYAIYANFL
jgi:hypothetical protein